MTFTLWFATCTCNAHAHAPGHYLHDERGAIQGELLATRGRRDAPPPSLPIGSSTWPPPTHVEESTLALLSTPPSLVQPPLL